MKFAGWVLASVLLVAQAAQAETALVPPAGKAALGAELKRIVEQIDATMDPEVFVGDQRVPKAKKARLTTLYKYATAEGAEALIVADVVGRKIRLTVRTPKSSRPQTKSFALNSKRLIGEKSETAILAFLRPLLPARSPEPIAAGGDADESKRRPAGPVTPNDEDEADEVLDGPMPGPSGEPKDPAPEVKEDGAAGPEPKEEAEDEAELSGGDERPKLRLHAGLQFLVRNLSYGGAAANRTGNLREYSVEIGAPITAISVGADVRPFAYFSDGFARNFGLSLGVDTSLGLKSRDVETETEYPTQFLRIDGTLRYEFHLGSVVTLSPRAGVRVVSFSTQAADLFPNVSYFSPHAGVALDLNVASWLGLFVGADVLLPLSQGALISTTYFSAGSTLGLAASVGAHFSILRWLGVMARFDYELYSTSLSPQPTDTYRAESASDSYMSLTLAPTVSF